MFFLLARQKDRQRLEQRSLVAVYAASLMLGFFMAWLFANPAVVIPVTAVCSFALLCLVRLMGDGSILYHLLLGGAWREIRLSRLTSAQVVDGITLYGLRQQLLWALLPALFMGTLDPRFGLPWFLAVLAGSLFGSCWGQLSVVHRVTPGFSLPIRQVTTFLVTLCLLIYAAGCIPFHLVLLPGCVWTLALLRCFLAAALENISEGLSLATEGKVQLRTLHWIPWSDNPIVARECARESQRMGSNMPPGLYFGSWGMLLAAIPIIYSSLLYFHSGHRWPPFIRENGGPILAGFLVAVGLFQAVRAGSRVFRALAEERDRQTLDLLVVTSLQPEDFVDGWAQVGFTTRQLDLITATLASLLCGFFIGLPLDALAVIVYAGLLALMLCPAGAYAGLLFGFRHCARQKLKRHAIFPLGIFLWLVWSLPLFTHVWSFLVVQGLAAYVVGRYARGRALRALRG